jgi:hypothetical protein
MAVPQSNSTRDLMRKILEEKHNNPSGGGSDLPFNVPKEVKYFKPSKEIHYIDILPYKTTVDKIVGKTLIPAGSIYYENTWFQHRIGQGKETRRYACPKSVGKPCPICEHRAELLQQGTDTAILTALKAVPQQFYNVVDTEEEAKGVQLWVVPYKFFGEILVKDLFNESAKHDEYQEFFTLDNGRTLKLRMINKPFNNKPNYQTLAVDFEPRQPYDQSVLGSAINLDAILNILSYDELKKIYLGIDGPAAVADEENMPRGMYTAPQSVAHILPQQQVVPPAAAPQLLRRRLPETVPQAPIQQPAPVEAAPMAVDNPCPYGHVWGVDNGKKVECDAPDGCDEAWQACFEKKEEMARQSATPTPRTLRRG